MKREVEIVPLWKVTAWDKKFNAVDKSMQEKIIKYKYLLANELNNLIEEGGNIRILYTTKDIAYTTEEKAKEFISEGEIVAIPWGGNATVKYYKGKFVTGDNRIATSLDTTVLDNKYLYYVLLSRNEEIESYYRGAGIKHPSMIDVLTMQIPLPSLSEQQRIVDILDKFEGMVENVEKELLLRQKQYEVYRKKIIFSTPIFRKACRLSDITKILRGKRLTKKELSDDNIYPVYHGGIEPIGKYNDYNRDANTVMIINVGASAGTVGFCNEKFWSSDGCFCIEKTDKVIDKYLYYYLLCKEHDIKSQVRYAGIPTLDQAVIENIEIPLPPLAKQQEIVAKLDKFEEMISTLKKELELRKKQYEYYREKLLTFE